MSGWAWLLVGWFVLNVVVAVAMVGRERRFRGTRAGAIAYMAVYSVLIYAVVQVAS